MAKIVATQAEKTLGRAMMQSVSALASSIGATLDADLSFLAKAKQDWEGGPFRVMFTVTKNMTAEQLEALPDPKAETGNNPAWFKAPVMVDGKERIKEVYFYRQLAHDLPGIVAKKARIEMLARSMKDPTKFNMSDIPQEIKDMVHDRRVSEMKKLEGEINGAVVSVTKAFELYHQFRKFQELPGVDCFFLYAIDPDTGKELDGSEEVGGRIEIENTKTPIIVQTKNVKRLSIDTMRIGIGTFMRFDVAKAMEGKGTYDAVVNSAPKKGTNTDPNNGNAGNRNVNTVETYVTAINDVTEFTERVQAEKNNATFEALRKACHANTKEGKDLFFNMCAQAAFLNSLIGSEKDQAEYQRIINALDGVKAA